MMRAPFPWFGGKARVADVIWTRLGDATNYVEPFAGSLAVLLARPDAHEWWTRIETVNDVDGLICNFWRAVTADPDAVAHAADWPVNECDLHARHSWLVERTCRITDQLCGDPDFHDAKAAGWWVWGLCSWIGSGWCSGNGPWVSRNGRLVEMATLDGDGINRKRPHLGGAGRGIDRQLPHLGGAGQGIKRQRPHLGRAGQGIYSQLPHLGGAGRGIAEQWSAHLRATMRELSNRLRRVRVCCGDWARICTYTPTASLGTTAVFLDPPYAVTNRYAVYNHDSRDVAHDVRAWALERGNDPEYRIALAGYDGEHEMPSDWECVKWKAHGGMAKATNENAMRERLWFSPACERPRRDVQLNLMEDFDG